MSGVNSRGGINTYGYVSGNPLSLADLLGLRPLNDREKCLLRPYIPQIDLDNADLNEGGIALLLFDPYIAITLGNNIYFRPGVYDGTLAAGIALLGHELYHVGQYRSGVDIFDFAWHGVDGHDNSPLEKPAIRLQAEILRGLKGPGGGGCNECKK